MNVCKRAIAIVSLLALLLTLSACGSQEEIYGKIAKIGDGSIVISNGTYDPSAQSDGAASGFYSDGSQSSYSLAEEIDTAGLPENAIVKLTLSDHIVTAVETLETKKVSGEAEAEETPQRSSLSAVYVVDGQKKDSSNESYNSSQPNIDTILVKNKGTFNMRGGMLTKSGNTTNENKSEDYGLNALFTASGGSIATLHNTQFTSSGDGANAVFATGKGTNITADAFDIYTSGYSSSGFEVTQGGVIEASDGEITTKGTYSAPLAVGSGGSSIQISETEILASGRRSPCIFSSGSMTASALTGTASNSPIAVLDCGSKLTLDDCLLLGGGSHGIMLYPQPSSAKTKKATLKVKDSKLTSTAKGSMFYVSGLNASVALENSSLYYDGRTLAEIRSGSHLSQKGSNQYLKGRIKCSKDSSATLNLTNGSYYKGAINTNGASDSVSITLDRSSSWNVANDSYLCSISNRNTRCSNIRSNGHTVYYNSSHPSNAWLGGKTITLPGGGKLAPAS